MQPLRWRDVYREAELYKAAVRIYTKPLFQWRKALSTSIDGKTLYDFAGRGLRGLDALHQSLRRGTFHFRPALALQYNLNSKHRTLYIAPWEDRIVDLLLYRALNRKLHHWFSPNSYAYRDRIYGLDRCQSRIAAGLRRQATSGEHSPLYVVKRDIADYFASVDHELLLRQLGGLVDRDDYLFTLLQERVRFLYHDGESAHGATRGIPFGTAIACLYANVFLTEMDRAIERIGDIAYFRYADDLLLISVNRDVALLAAERLERSIAELRLTMKASHHADLVVAMPTASIAANNLSADAAPGASDQGFIVARDFRHLGLQFRAGGEVALSRDKCRKIQNLFRFAFRRARRRWQRIPDTHLRAQTLVTIATETIDRGVRNVAILDYYLKHVTDEAQIASLDRWLAEEVLGMVFGGHKKGHFRRISFAHLRQMGLPSLVHRRRLILTRRIESPFFVWQRQKATRAFRGTVANLSRASAGTDFSSFPKAAASACL